MLLHPRGEGKLFVDHCPHEMVREAVHASAVRFFGDDAQRHRIR